MNELFSKIDQRMLENYIKIMLFIISDYRLETGMTWQEEENLRERFRKLVYTLSSQEMVELAQEMVKLCRLYLDRHPEKGYLTIALLRDALGFRYSSKYLDKHPEIRPRLTSPEEEIVYSADEEKKLVDLILEVKKNVPDKHYDVITALIDHVSGKFIDFMKEVYKKYAAKNA